MLALLVFFQNFAGALDDASREAGEASDFNAITLVGAAGIDAAQKNNFVGRFPDRDVHVLHAGEQIGELGEFVIMRGKKRARARVLLQMLDDRPSDGKAVKRCRAAADFIEKNKTRWCGVMQDGGDFAHLHQKGRAAAGKIIACADAREDAVGDGQLGGTSGNERAHLRHQNNQRALPKIRGFTAHVRASDQQKLLAARVEAKIVWNEALAALAEKFLDDGMTAADDEQFAARVEFGARVAAVCCQLCKGSEHVELCDGGSRAAKARSLGGDRGAHLDENLALDLENALVRRENLALILFQFGRSEPFSVYQGLFALVVGGCEMEIGLRNLHVVPKDLIKANLQRCDAGALALAVFHRGDNLFAVLAEVAKLIEFAVITAADDSGIARESGRLVGDGAFEPLAHVGQFIKLAVQLAKQRAATDRRRRQKVLEHRKLAQRFSQRHEFARRRQA